MQIKITDYGYDGEGIGRYNGKVCFVPFTIKDELVEINVLKDKKQFIEASIKNIVNKSPERQNPPCPYFSVCGGCAFQHIKYEKEIKIKSELLNRQLSKVGVNIPIKIYSSPQVYNYRNKLTLFVKNKDIGLNIRQTNIVVNIDGCLLAEKKINTALYKVKNFIYDNHIWENIEKIVFRQEDDNCLINFVIKNKVLINYKTLILALGESFGIYETFKQKTNYIVGKEFLIKNNKYGEFKYNINSFHQINEKIEKELYDKVLENVLTNEVVNCYSGGGLLSAILATKCKFVEAIELGDAEHLEAEKMKKEKDIKNLLNYHGDCANILKKISLKNKTVIVDPPRSGMSVDVSKILNSSDSEKIIYISCNSATLVRDIKFLNNYSAKEVFLFDMFPRTGEYETMIILKKNKN